MENDLASFDIRVGRLVKYLGYDDVVRIPNHVEEIASGAFEGCETVMLLTVPPSVQRIESRAFANMPALRTVVLPDKLTKIPESCFAGCERLENIDLSHVTILCEYAFAHTNLSRVELTQCRYISGSVFEGCQALRQVTIGQEDLRLGIEQGTGYPFAGCNGVEVVRLPSLKNLLPLFGSFAQNDRLEQIILEGVSRVYWEGTEQQFRQDSGITERVRFTDPDGEPIKPQFLQNEGCYIATAVYGSYDAPQVRVLRQYRDNVLRQSVWGRAFIQVYYFFSPSAAHWLKNTRYLNAAVRHLLDGWVTRLHTQF